jgi:hypothetical protein
MKSYANVDTTKAVDVNMNSIHNKPKVIVANHEELTVNAIALRHRQRTERKNKKSETKSKTHSIATKRNKTRDRFGPLLGYVRWAIAHKQHIDDVVANMSLLK